MARLHAAALPSPVERTVSIGQLEANYYEWREIPYRRCRKLHLRLSPGKKKAPPHNLWVSSGAFWAPSPRSLGIFKASLRCPMDLA